MDRRGEKPQNPFDSRAFIDGRIRQFHLDHPRLPMQLVVEQASENEIQKRAGFLKRLFTRLEPVWAENREKRQELIEASNTLKPGEPDYLGRMHKAANSRSPYETDYLHRIYDAQHNHDNPPRRGWGTFRNQTRKSLGKQASIRVQNSLGPLNQDQAIENIINNQLAQAEREDRKRKKG